LILVLLVSESSKSKVSVNGRNYVRVDDDPVKIRVAEIPGLHSGARLAAKLKAKIIVNETEFNHAGEMSVDDRHLYHEALEALFTPDITVSTTESPKLNHNKTWLVAVIPALARNCLSLTRRFLRRKR
jgi:hypothetical protein